MTPSTVLALSVLLTLAAPKPTAPASEAPSYDAGQKRFASGDFEGALQVLEGAAREASDDATLERIHLLRAQCFAALQQFERAEAAFTRALEANPEASLDPARVDPTVVRLLESVRRRLSGLVDIDATPAGAEVLLGGERLGTTPLHEKLPVGRHRLEVRWKDGSASGDVLVRPGQTSAAFFVQGPVTQLPAPTVEPCPVLPPMAPPPESPSLRGFGDVRGVLEVPSNPGAYVVGAFEAGGGVEVSWFRVGLWARLYSTFGLVPRGTFAVPVHERVHVIAELAVPVQFLDDGPGVGLWGVAGVEFAPLPWLAFSLTVGARHYFTWPGRNDPTAFTTSVGIRLGKP